MNLIKEKRIEKGMKQLDVAKKVGVSTASISYYERGKKKPSMNNAFKIAKALDTTIDELFIFETKENWSKGVKHID